MKKLVGLIKEIDENGRITMPKDFRTTFRLDKEVEMIPTKDSVLIRNPEYILTNRTFEETSRPIVIVLDSETKKFAR